MVIEAFLFDVDGTLADTERDGHRPAFNEAFKELGLGWHWDEALYGKLLVETGGKERIKYFVESFLPARKRPSNIEQFAVELHRIKTKFYIKLVNSGELPLRPGVKRLLMESRNAGLRLGIATTTNPENVFALLHHHLGKGADRWFEVIAAGDMVSAKKPAPDIYLCALRGLGLPAEKCIAFEDSESGLRSSIGAGLRTVVTVSTYTANEDFEGALAVLSDFGEPSAPFKIIKGASHGRDFLDLPLIRQWAGEN